MKRAAAHISSFPRKNVTPAQAGAGIQSPADDVCPCRPSFPRKRESYVADAVRVRPKNAARRLLF